MKNKNTCHVVFMGSAQAGEDLQEAAVRLSMLFKIDSSIAKRILTSERPIIKKNVDEETAEAFVRQMAMANFKCRIEPVLELSTAPKRSLEFNCPKCGHRCPLDGVYANGTVCPACQVVVSKYLRRQNESLAPAIGGGRSADSHIVENEDGGRENPILEKETVFPVWFIKLIKWGLTAIGAYIAIQTGISVFDINNHEILYSLQTGEKICQGNPMAKYHPELSDISANFPALDNREPIDLCIQSFKLHILNGGRKAQPQTVVRLRMPSEIKQSMVAEPVFLDFDRTRREGMQVRILGDITSYALGMMKPADQVYMRFKMLIHRDEAVGWNDVLEKIDIAKGDLNETDSPRLTLITRILLGVFAAFDKSAKDIAEELSDVFLDNATEAGKTLSQEFDTADADLEVSIDSGRLEHYGNTQTARYTATIQVRNHGPAEVSNVKLRFQIPDSVTLQSLAFNIEGDTPKISEILEEGRTKSRPGQLPKECLKENDGAVCTFRTLLPAKNIHMYLNVLDQRTGASMYQASVAGDRKDPDLKNNQTHHRVAGQ